MEEKKITEEEIKDVNGGKYRPGPTFPKPNPIPNPIDPVPRPDPTGPIRPRPVPGPRSEEKG